MEKLKMHSPNFVQENIEKLAELFPDCVTESTDEDGNLKRPIDFDLLRQELSSSIVEGPQERYRLDWPGKRKALLTANAPIAKTLRPYREKKESVDFDTTENLFIEGDNLDALKLLQETYLGKVKMIYIDPPYNTGKDFVYKDNFAVESGQWLVESGQKDEDGNRLVANTDSNGRFHSDWLSMMYPRLKLARNLLKDDGVIFISIDDNEVHNLRKMCDEVFGAENFQAIVAWQKRYTRSNNTVDFTTVVEHIIVYSKSEEFTVNLLPRSEEADARYTNPDNDVRGVWKGASFLNPATPSQRPNLCYPIENPNTGQITSPTTNAWRRSKEEFANLARENRLYWGKDGTQPVPSVKMFLSESRGLTPINFWGHEYAGNTDQGTAELQSLMGAKLFDNPKPTMLVYRCLEHGVSNDDIILDFFAGSATTAQAVMQLNAEDGGKRKFIIVQLPEETDEKSEAFKAGYKTIAEISKERIRRAGKKVVSEQWEVISKEGKKVVSEQWEVISKEEKIRYGCKELSRADCMTEINGSFQGNLFDSEETSTGGAVQSVRSDEAGSGVDSVKHSGGTGTQINERIYTVSNHSQRLGSGTGDATSTLRESGIPCRYGYFGSDESSAGDREDVGCSYKNTVHCPLTTNHSPDIGFRVLKVDSSNMADVYYTPDAVEQNLLSLLTDNIKDDRTAEDLLFQVLLDWGVDLTLPITKETIEDREVFFVDGNALAACFVKNGRITEDFYKELAKRQPLRVVFRDSGFKDDSVKINVEQIFRLMSPHTDVKTI